jgi:hypothetical protein
MLKMKCLFIGLFITLCSCAQDHRILGIENARNELKDALKEKPGENLFVRKSIKDRQTAINEAEPILFRAYDKDQIIKERPYEAYLINGYWVLSGTLPKKMLGGAFLIIINSVDGRVIKLTHYK